MNFTSSDSWNYSFALRYPIDKIISFDNLYFYENNGLLTCQHFFEFDIEKKQFLELEKCIENGYQIRFSYLNDSSLSQRIKEWSEEKNISFEIIDEWDAPRLVVDTDISDYLKKNSHEQIRRNYKRYDKEKVNYRFYHSSNMDVMKLWNYVLDIDYHSWKREENSDMKSLNREDLQYLPFLLNHPKESDLLVVCDLEDNPLAYSLMFKGEMDYWYAVKWGASNVGREKYVGFMCLFHHLEYLYSVKNKLLLDFWGRRNKTYDELKNSDIKRRHILLSKGVS